ncbi:acetyl-CoA acetyltransferase [Corynebacterium sp. zg-331]|uniref:acetyl-CoA acetyltransferase n=1 Tax=unclassified Corynebacterium TaxID=2624378 RepID=UPI00128D3F50|nr:MULTISPECIES: acetyl-CoA acetyltransferase [unclassified Corynebacterium]MBC3185725.1 acetyl-CoA acetyltransferase [Corynebacterium sp. zg-331]MPV52218.1 acetyl-CoA acetyltransferase [Corynebacterium sp. zg331]
MHTVSSLLSPTRLDDPFQRRYRLRPLPRGLREEAAGMSWNLFRATYSPEPELSIAILDEEPHTYRDFRYILGATRRSTTQPPRRSRHRLAASGPADACSSFLAREGYPVEILRFHQHSLFEATATFVLAHHGPRTAWAMGLGATPHLSLAQAFSCAAARLHG